MDELNKIGREKPGSSAMYGEMPVIEIGKFNLSQMYENDKSKIWLEIDGEEGGEFSTELLEPYLSDFFKKYF